MSIEYKGRSLEEQRELNRKRRQEYRDKKKLESLGVASNSFVLIDTVSFCTCTPKLSMKDRLLAKSGVKEEKEAEKKPDKKRVEKTESLVSSVLPLTFSALIAVNARNMMKEPYKDCAPTQEEVSSVLTPLFSYISRQIEITGKASQDAIDLFTALLAGVTVGIRVAMTRAQINESLKAGQKNEQKQHNDIAEQIINIQRSNNQGTDNQYSRNIAREIIARDLDDTHGSNGHSINDDGSEELRSREARLVGELMRRDRQGRTRLGLAP